MTLMHEWSRRALLVSVVAASGARFVAHAAAQTDAPQAGGFCLYGADTGELPLDPTLDIHTRDPLPLDLGVGPDTPIAIPAGP